MMTKERWDWSFASFAEEPALDEEETLSDGEASDEELTSAHLPLAGTAGEGELERHLWRLRIARTPKERRMAATAALRFLEETRRATRRARRRAAEEEPTLVDHRALARMPAAEGVSSGDASLP